MWIIVVMLGDCGDLQHRARLIRLSAEQRPRLTQTAMGGKMMARMPRKTSVLHMVWMFFSFFEVLNTGIVRGLIRRVL